MSISTVAASSFYNALSGMPIPTAVGGRDAGENWSNWAVFDASVPDRDVRFWANEELCSSGVQCYTDRPWIRRTGTRVLVVVSGGLDI